MNVQASFRAEPAEVSAARRFVAEALACWGSERDRDMAVLLVSELVTNTVVHAGSDVGVTVSSEGAAVTVGVGDGSAVMPFQFDRSTGALSGRGVQIVAAMADDRGVHALPGTGKVVWFTLITTAG